MEQNEPSMTGDSNASVADATSQSSANLTLGSKDPAPAPAPVALPAWISKFIAGPLTFTHKAGDESHSVQVTLNFDAEGRFTGLTADLTKA